MTPWLRIFRNIFGIAMLVLLIHYVGINNIYSSMKSMKIFYFPILIGLYFLFLFFSALCIRTLIKKELPLKKIFKYYSLSWVYGLISPGKIGELSLVYFLKKEGIDTIPSFVVSFLDKFITFIFLSIVASFGFFFFFDTNQAIYIMAIIGILFVLLSLITHTDLLRFLIPKRYHIYLSSFSNEYKSFFKNHKERVYANFFYTTLRWATNSFLVFVIFSSLGVTVNLIYILIINTITALLSLVPVTINGLGIRQSMGVYLFSKININPAVSLNMYLISLSTTYLMAFGVYSYYSYFNGDAKPQ